ncbi:MAG: carbon monoxide dehydrogenase [Pseudomonadales bacterium]|nr:carbon monoxide dehydrogenase [Pseudomonadales bacterium]
MYQFNYHKPASLNDAISIFQGSDDPMYLSGGMTLIPTMKQRLAAPTDLIDLSGIAELTGISVSDTVVSVGGFTPHNVVAGSREIAAKLPVLCDLVGLIGDNQVRNRGTMGGSVANSDPAADYPAAVVGLGATVVTQEREIAGDDFFKDLFETALNPGEIITRIDFPVAKRAGYSKFPNPASRYAVVGVLVAEFSDGVRVGVTGAGPCAFRATGIENVLNADLEPGAIDSVEVPDAGFNSDLHASAEYRAHLVKVMAKRATEALLA